MAENDAVAHSAGRRTTRFDYPRANRLPLPGAAAALMKPVAIRFARRSGADDETVRRHLAELPEYPGRVPRVFPAAWLDSARREL